ncbi:MAG: type IV secretion system DNA-binding domain-containing protein, partial [Gammaproteobacteria bacterium]|nr:type IV secretion system DNA-binding domain-containing protein [Gammaproteobacteria bacterium]
RPQAFLVGAVFWLAAPLAAAARHLSRLRGGLRPSPAPSPLRVWLGDANGLLAARGRTRRPPRPVVLDARDLSQNLLVLGGIGSGKTTSVIQPVLLQAFAQHAGGLVFDIKGDFGQAVHALARRTGRTLTTIGPGRRALNLLRGLTPETAASFLRSALLLAGAPGDPFWVETAIELCRNALGVLSFAPEHYHLAGLYQYLFHDEIRARIDAQLHAEMAGLSPQALRLLRSYQAYHEGVFTRFDSKVAAGVLASCAQVLTPFTNPHLVDAFCPPNDAISIDGLGQGEVVLVDLPLSVWGTGAKVIYTFCRACPPGAVCLR